jgi:GntR family transcriptional regulator, vanillate catabolism transcriptional regulator
MLPACKSNVAARAHIHSAPVTATGTKSDKTQIARAVFTLRDQILGGQFAAGERMSELPLVDRIGVSRTPLRLALATLEHEGLLEKLPHGGYTVREFTQAEIADAIEVRGVLEGTAARFAAERGVGRRELQRLVDLNEQMAAVMHLSDFDSFALYVEVNRRFHMRLLKLSGSTQLQRAWTSIVALPFASPSALVLTEVELSESRQIVRLAHSQHVSLVEAIALRQGTRAEGVAREHARISLSNLELVMRERQVLQRMPGASLISSPSSEEGHSSDAPVAAELLE